MLEPADVRLVVSIRSRSSIHDADKVADVGFEPVMVVQSVATVV